MSSFLFGLTLGAAIIALIITAPYLWTRLKRWIHSPENEDDE